MVFSILLCGCRLCGLAAVYDMVALVAESRRSLHCMLHDRLHDSCAVHTSQHTHIQARAGESPSEVRGNRPFGATVLP